MSFIRTLTITVAVTLLFNFQPARLSAADAPMPLEAAGKPDLSIPVSTTKAFFNAVKAGDFVTVERALAPEMQEKVKKRNVGMEGFTKGLMAELGKILSISDEAIFPRGGEAEGRCKVPVTTHKPDKQPEVNNVKLAKVNGEWLISGF